MKALFVNSMYYPDKGGGIEFLLPQQCKILLDSGWEVGVVCHTSAEPTNEIVEGVQVFRVPIRNWYRFAHLQPVPSWKKLLWHIRDSNNPSMSQEFTNILEIFNPDIVCSHNLSGWSISVWEACKAKSVPIIHFLHDQYLLCVNSKMFRNGKTCMKPCTICKTIRRGVKNRTACVNAVIGVSDFILSKHIKEGLFAETPIKRTIHNIKSDNFDSLPWRCEYNLDGNINIGFLGAVEHYKGAELFAKLSNQTEFSSMSFFMAGSVTPHYRRKLLKMGGPGNLQILGPTNNYRFLNMVDVLIVPSLWEETLGMVVIEAMAIGIPVVGSRTGGIPELITPGINGELFEPGDINEHRNALQRILIEKPNRITIRESARKWYDKTAWREQFFDVVAQIQDRRNS